MAGGAAGVKKSGLVQIFAEANSMTNSLIPDEGVRESRDIPTGATVDWRSPGPRYDY